MRSRSWNVTDSKTPFRPDYFMPTLRMPVHKMSHDIFWYANDVHLSAIWENTALVQRIRCEPLGEHLIHWTCAVFSHIARKMNKVCIVSHNQVTHNITAIDCSSNYGRPMARVRYGLIPIGPIRLIGKTTELSEKLSICGWDLLGPVSPAGSVLTSVVGRGSEWFNVAL